jgi:hypothetical protein
MTPPQISKRRWTTLKDKELAYLGRIMDIAVGINADPRMGAEKALKIGVLTAAVQVTFLELVAIAEEAKGFLELLSAEEESERSE